MTKAKFKNTLYGIESSYSNISQDIDKCDSRTIALINDNFAQHYNFAPLRSRYSKTVDDSYIANSCTYCDALMGRHFLKSWGSYYSSQTVKTEEVTVPRYGRILMEFGEKSIYRHSINYEVGRWVLIESL